MPPPPGWTPEPPPPRPGPCRPGRGVLSRALRPGRSGTVNGSGWLGGGRGVATTAWVRPLRESRSSPLEPFDPSQIEDEDGGTADLHLDVDLASLTLVGASRTQLLMAWLAHRAEG